MKSVKYLALTIILFGCIPDREKEINYYPNGGVKEEFDLNNGKRDGLARSFFPSGKLKAVGFYKDGIPDSCYVHYYENGNKETEGCFNKKGIRTGKRKFYFESGELEQIEYLNAKGEVIDYVTFNKDGTRNLDKALIMFESEGDTIKLGESYKAKVRFANRKYNYTDVIIGNPRDKRIFDQPRLYKKDSITSLLEIRPKDPGPYLIEGVMLDIDFKVKDKDTTVLDYRVIEFKKPIFVQSQRSL